jgi:hypothetical protein
MSTETKTMVRGTAQSIPHDPNEDLVIEIGRSYPFGGEQFGLKSIIRAVVYTVMEMKRRGII